MYIYINCLTEVRMRHSCREKGSKFEPTSEDPKWGPEPPHAHRQPAAKFKKRNSDGNSKRM